MVNKDVCHLFMCLHSVSSLMKYPKFLVQFVSRSFVLLLLGCMNSHILKIRHLSCMCITNILFQFVSCLLISQCFFQTTELFFFLQSLIYQLFLLQLCFPCFIEEIFAYPKVMKTFSHYFFQNL